MDMASFEDKGGSKDGREMALEGLTNERLMALVSIVYIKQLLTLYEVLSFFIL